MRLIAFFAWAALLPAAVAAQAPPAGVDAYRGRALTPGAWTLRLASGSSEASYGAAGLSRLTLRCEMAARRVRITRPDHPAGPIMIITSSVTRTLAASAELTASDPLLDAIAFSRGRFVVMTPSSTGAAGDVLIVPAWPEAARIVEDCRK